MVLLYASKYHDIHTVVNVSGRYDLQRGIEERLGKEFMQRIKEDGFIDVKNKTGNLLICIQHGHVYLMIWNLSVYRLPVFTCFYASMFCICSSFFLSFSENFGSSITPSSMMILHLKLYIFCHLNFEIE